MTCCAMSGRSNIELYPTSEKCDEISLCLYLIVDMAEHSLLVCQVVESIPRGGPTELFLVPASDPRLV